MDGIPNPSCNDGIAHHGLDGQEPTHNRSVAGSRPASPTEQDKEDVTPVADQLADVVVPVVIPPRLPARVVPAVVLDGPGGRSQSHAWAGCIV
jgi:hypothetical protein